MTSNKTTLVIGAGASHEANLPTGSELKNEIASLLNIRFDGPRLNSGDHLIVRAIRLAAQQDASNSLDFSDYVRAARRIRDAMPQAESIDNFIDDHQGYRAIEYCGKLAIIRAILRAEKKSTLFIKDDNVYNKINFYDIQSTWFNSFFQWLTRDCVPDRLEERLRNVTLVIFNYDRCVEHYLYNALQNYYGIESNDAKNLVEEMAIYHPYGMVGKLPWAGGAEFSKFGAEPTPEQVALLAKEIQTFTQGTDPNSSDITEIHESIAHSDRIIFLGFAYHKLNLELLSPPKNVSRSNATLRAFGTAFGISPSDCEVISSELSRLVSPRQIKCHIRSDLQCNGLFREYSRRISLV